MLSEVGKVEISRPAGKGCVVWRGVEASGMSVDIDVSVDVLGGVSHRPLCFLLLGGVEQWGGEDGAEALRLGPGT